MSITPAAPPSPAMPRPDPTAKELFALARKNLIRSSARLPDHRKTVLVKEVLQLADELAAELFWPTVQDAHAVAGIAPQDFMDGLYLPTCMKNGRSLLSKPLSDEAKADPYAYARDHWNLRMWAGYMLFGGGRYITLDDGWVAFADDQDSVFRYFGIRPMYTTDARRKLTSLLSTELELIFRGYNVLVYADPDRECFNPSNLDTQIHLSFLMDYVYALQTIIKAFVTGEARLRKEQGIVRGWNVAYKSNEQKTRMLERFYQKLGVTLYRLSDVIAYINAGAALDTAVPIFTPDLRADQITRQTILPDETDAVRRLLKNAGIPVNAEGYLAVQGNVYLFASVLQHAWTDEHLQAGTGKDKLQQWRTGTQKKRLDFAPLTPEQAEEAFDQLYAIQQRLPTVFAQALYAAHQAAVPPVSAAEFYHRLGVPTEVRFDDSGKPVKMFILHPSAWEPGMVSDNPMDYYNKLDAQAICKYLFFGGARNLNRNGTPRYADDPDAFFAYFGLPYGYNDGRSLTGQYAAVLKSMLGQRNTLFHPTMENKKLLTADLLEEYLTLCRQLLRPLCDKTWDGQAQADTLMQFIDSIFIKLNKMGVFTYTIDSILDALNLSECSDRFEQMLTDSGLRVVNHAILPPVPWDTFQKMLRDAWTIYEINPDLGVQQLKSQLPAADHTPPVRAEAAPKATDAPAPVPDAQLRLQTPAAGPADNPAESPKALLEQGKRLLDNPANGEDRLRALALLMEAARMNYAPAMVQLGQCYEKKNGVGKMDWCKAFEWYQKAADLNDPEGCFHTGRSHEFSIGTGKDLDMAAVYYHKAMDRLPIARVYMAWCFIMGYGVSKDEAKGIAMLQELAEAQNSAAQNTLGLCFEYGYGVPRDFDAAAKWYQKSADAGYASGVYNLGRCYRHGYGVSIDTAKAEKLTREAALQGNTGALVQLARWFADDTLAQLSPSSPRPGFDPYLEQRLEDLAAQKHTPAQVALGGLYILDGMWCRCVNRSGSHRVHGIQLMLQPDARKLKQAFAWCSAAADFVNRRAKINLARCLAYGFGTEINPDRAIALMTEEGDYNNAAVMYELAEYLLERHRDAMGLTLHLPYRPGKTPSADAHIRTKICLGNKHRFQPTRYNYPSVPDEAFGWYYLAGNRGHQKAQEWLCRYYTGALKEACDPAYTPYWPEAVNWSRKAAKNGDRYAQEWAFRYYTGELTRNTTIVLSFFSNLKTPDWEMAHKLAVQLAESGEANDLFRLAELNNGSNPDCRFLKPEEVFRLYLRVQDDEAPENLHAESASLKVGDCHADGFGTPVNPDEAFRIYLRLWQNAVRSKNCWTAPLKRMIDLCEEGRGSTTYHQQAMKCLTDAVNLPGNASAAQLGMMKYLLAKRYLRGGRMIPGTSFLQRLGNPPADDALPLKPDYKKAVQLLKEAQPHCSEAKELLATLQG